MDVHFICNSNTYILHLGLIILVTVTIKNETVYSWLSMKQ